MTQSIWQNFILPHPPDTTIHFLDLEQEELDISLNSCYESSSRTHKEETLKKKIGAKKMTSVSEYDLFDPAFRARMFDAASKVPIGQEPMKEPLAEAGELFRTHSSFSPEQEAPPSFSSRCEAERLFAEQYPNEWAWMSTTTFPFGAAMVTALQRYGRLTSNQLAAVQRCVRREERDARNPPDEEIPF